MTLIKFTSVLLCFIMAAAVFMGCASIEESEKSAGGDANVSDAVSEQEQNKTESSKNIEVASITDTTPKGTYFSTASMRCAAFWRWNTPSLRRWRPFRWCLRRWERCCCTGCGTASPITCALPRCLRPRALAGWCGRWACGSFSCCASACRWPCCSFPDRLVQNQTKQPDCVKQSGCFCLQYYSCRSRLRSSTIFCSSSRTLRFTDCLEVR